MSPGEPRPRGSHARAFAIVVIVAIALTGRAAAADDSAADLVREAVAAQDELRFDDALRLLERAWQRGESDPEQVRRIFALSGQAAGAIGDGDAARLWFSRWLSVEPDAELPAGSSPKLATWFADARTGLGGTSIAATARARADSLAVTLERDPLSLIARARAGDTTRALQQGRALELPTAERVELLDRHGNVVLAIEPSRELAPPPPSPRRWYARWPAWAGATAGLAVIASASLGVAFAARGELEDLDAASSEHEYTERLAVERRFDRAQWAARLSLGGALVTGIVASVLYVRRGEHAVTIVPTTGGAGVTWTVGF